MQVQEGIHRLTQGAVNFYLIEEGGRLLLVDAGAPGDWDLLVRTVADLGRRLDNLEAVLRTHAHADYIGTAERARAAADARVWVHQADAAMATEETPPKNDGKARSYLLRTGFYRTTFSLVRRGGQQNYPGEGGGHLRRRRDPRPAGPPPAPCTRPGTPWEARRCCWRGGGCC